MDPNTSNPKQEGPRPKRPRGTIVLLILIITAVLMLMVGRSLSDSNKVAEVSFTEFMKKKRLNQIKSIEIEGDNITATMHDGFPIGHNAVKIIHTKLPPTFQGDMEAYKILSGIT